MKILLLLIYLAMATGVAAPLTISTTPQIKLVWHKSLEEGVAGYRVHLGQQSREYTEIINVGLGEPVPIEDIENCEWFEEEDRLIEHVRGPDPYILPRYGKWYAAVTVYNINGLDSPYSNEVSTDRIQPSPPEGVWIKQ